MIIHAAFAAKALRLSGIAAPDRVPPCLLDSVGLCGPAPITKPMPKRDGVEQLQIQREILLAQAMHARNLRQSKLASLIEAELREVTLEILWWGQHQ